MNLFVYGKYDWIMILLYWIGLNSDFVLLSDIITKLYWIGLDYNTIILSKIVTKSDEFIYIWQVWLNSDFVLLDWFEFWFCYNIVRYYNKVILNWFVLTI